MRAVGDAQGDEETRRDGRDVANRFVVTIAHLARTFELQFRGIVRRFNVPLLLAQQSPRRRRVKAFARWVIVIFFTSHRHTGQEAWMRSQLRMQSS